MVENDTIISPCISVCKLDQNGHCMGCYRSAKEIADWYILDNEGKRKILVNIIERNPKRQRK